MGYADKILEFLNNIYSCNKCIDNIKSNQRIWINYCNYIESNSFNLDHKNYIFFNYSSYNNNNNLKFIDSRILINNQKPCIISGPANNNLNIIIKQLGYKYNINNNLHSDYITKFFRYYIKFFLKDIILIILIIIFIFIILSFN